MKAAFIFEGCFFYLGFFGRSPDFRTAQSGSGFPFYL
jgi:hypothetical protein